MKKLFGTYIIKYQPEGPDSPITEVDFTPPFKRIGLYEGLIDAFKGADFPAAEDLHTEAARLKLVAVCDQFKIQCGEPKTTARLLDKVIIVAIEFRI